MHALLRQFYLFSKEINVFLLFKANNHQPGHDTYIVANVMMGLVVKFSQTLQHPKEPASKKTFCCIAGTPGQPCFQDLRVNLKVDCQVFVKA